MAYLTACKNCGKRVSSEATECPHCGKNPTYIKKCEICGKRIENSKLSKHPECLRSYIQSHQEIQEFSCPVCYKVFAYKEFYAVGERYPLESKWEYLTKCPECGHYFDFRRCDWCLQPVLKEYARNVGSGEIGYESYCHRVCSKHMSRCFIATVVYGSSLNSSVLLLKDFRDNILIASPMGEKIITWYYKISPAVADFLEDHHCIKILVKYSLVQPFVWIIQHLYHKQ